MRKKPTTLKTIKMNGKTRNLIKYVNYLFEVNWNLSNSLNTKWSPVWLYITFQYYIYHWRSCNGYGFLVHVQVEDQEWYRYWYLYSHNINTWLIWQFFQKFFKLQNVSLLFTSCTCLARNAYFYSKMDTERLSSPFDDNVISWYKKLWKQE